MPAFLSDTQANMLDRAQDAQAQLLGDLRDLCNDILADADSDRDAQAMALAEAAFSAVYLAHHELRAIREFMREPIEDLQNE